MNITITGATGFIGRYLSWQLIKKGHKLQILTRNTEKAKQILNETSCSFINWNGECNDELKNIIRKSDAIINLAGENIGNGVWSNKKKKRILNSRVNIGTSLNEAIQAIDKKPDIFIQASALGFYGNSSNTKFTEKSPNGQGFLAEVCEKWENSTNDLSDKLRYCIIRTGIVLKEEFGILEKMTPLFKMFIGGHLGNGKQIVPWIHLHDEINAIIFLLENSNCNGIYNLNAPSPVTMKHFCKTLANVLHRPSWLHAPGFALKIMLGEMANEMLLAGQNAIPQRLTQACFQFKYTKLDIALDNLYS